MMKACLTSLPALLIFAQTATAQPVLPVFDPTAFVPGAAIDNPYLPLLPGLIREFAGMTADDEGEAVQERTVQTYVGPGPVIAGVTATVIRDEAFQGNLLVESTLDYYAQDRDGNVWYLGEDVINLHYDDDDKVSRVDGKGTWRAGQNGAQPGWAMPANPQPGLTYEQEHAPADQALDRAEILGLSAPISVPAGTFDPVLSILETSAIEPDLREVKHYGKGIGLIREDESVDHTHANPEAQFDLIRKAP
jgi:hypothetical protein